MENYGETIATLRKEKGLTQRELGQALNVTYQAVSKWENDQSQPPVDTFIAICKFFGITPDEFMRRAAGESAEQVTPSPEPVAAQTQATASVPESSLSAPVEPQSAPVQAQSTIQPQQSVPVVSAPSASAQAGVTENMTQDNAAPQTPKPKRKLSVGFLIVMILAIVLGLGTSVTCLVFFGKTGTVPAVISILLGYFVFSFTILIGHESVVWDVFLGALFKSVNVPGVIFTLDINGIVFLFVYKCIIAPIVTAVVWLVFVIGGFILSFFMSGFVFPFRIPTIYRETFGGKVPKKKDFSVRKNKDK